jgi:hypothetical protein
MQVRVIATIVIDGWHQWNNAPARQQFLAWAHRHQFVIRGERACVGLDREIECFDLADEMRASLEVFREGGTHMFHGKSCEMIAMHILTAVQLDRCEVLEDGLQGASVEASVTN